MTDRDLYDEVRSIMNTFDSGEYSYQDAQRKINDAFKRRIESIPPPPPPSQDKQALLDAITPEGAEMRFSVDGSEELFSLQDIITADDGLTVEDVIYMQNTCVGGLASFGLGADCIRFK
jgi:hypothetical protein